MKKNKKYGMDSYDSGCNSNRDLITKDDVGNFGEVWWCSDDLYLWLVVGG